MKETLMVLILGVFIAGCIPPEAEPISTRTAPDEPEVTTPPDENEGVLYTTTCEQVVCYDESMLPEPGELLHESESSLSGLDVKRCFFSCIPTDEGFESITRTWEKGPLIGEECWQLSATSVSEDSDCF